MTDIIGQAVILLGKKIKVVVRGRARREGGTGVSRAEALVEFALFLARVKGLALVGGLAPFARLVIKRKNFFGDLGPQSSITGR